MIKEAPGQDYTRFLTIFGSLQQTTMIEFTGSRVTPPGWAKCPAELPEGWEKLELERVWVRVESNRRMGVNGRPTVLTR